MGKPTGFIEYKRLDNTRLAPVIRVKNYNEFIIPVSAEQRKEQAARCMNCGVPFCQSGTVFGGMYSGCPLHNLIPEWNDEIYRGNIKEALKRLLKTNNFPEFTGRVCPALCEAACVNGMMGESVTVHFNELSIIEQGFENGLIKPNPPKVRSGKKVAVIGSGPSGLSVADCLNKRGHSVTVFERASKPGGLLMFGIPNMKLDKKTVDRRISLMEAEGIIFKTNTDVSNKKTADGILNEYDAVILCCGAKKPRELNVNGFDAAGVYFAVDYLTDATKKVTQEQENFKISANGKNVIIVGGGDTGNDCLGTAVRQGCKSAVQLEIMSALPNERAKNNPWPQWPKVLKTDYGQQEYIEMYGSDPRVYETTVKEILKDKKGNITAVKTIMIAAETDKKTGKRIMKETEGSEKTLPCELLLVAAGFIGCENSVANAFGVTLNERGNIKTDLNSYYTSVPKVFAAGDAHRGQSLVVWAIKEGRECAEEADIFLLK